MLSYGSSGTTWRGRLRILPWLVTIVVVGIACGSETGPPEQSIAASFDPQPVLNRNATPTPTPIPTATPEPTPTPTLPPTPTATPTPTPTPTPRFGTAENLQDALTDLVEEADEYSPGVEAAITVNAEGTTATASTGLEAFQSASLAKAWWVAAAVSEGGTTGVADSAEAIFRYSDNAAAGRVIDAVGVDTINGLTRSWGMSDTFLSIWVYSTTAASRQASDRPDFGPYNVTTTDDAASFFTQLVAGELLNGPDTRQVLAWMTETPDRPVDDAYGSVLVAQLPLPIARSAAHKAGWLPPNCCNQGPHETTLVAAGAIPYRPTDELRADNSYQVAIATFGGADYNGQAAWMAWASRHIAEIVGGEPPLVEAAPE